jgi:chromosomal replication initiator protein
MRQVSEKHGVTSKDLIGPSRVQQVVHARYEAMYRVRRELVLSFERVGQFFGGRDHTTVLYGVREHARRNGLTL